MRSSRGSTEWEYGFPLIVRLMVRCMAQVIDDNTSLASRTGLLACCAHFALAIRSNVVARHPNWGNWSPLAGLYVVFFGSTRAPVGSSVLLGSSGDRALLLRSSFVVVFSSFCASVGSFRISASAGTGNLVRRAINCFMAR